MWSKAGEPNVRSTVCITCTGQWPGSYSLVRKLLLLIYKVGIYWGDQNTAIERLPWLSLKNITIIMNLMKLTTDLSEDSTDNVLRWTVDWRWRTGLLTDSLLLVSLVSISLGDPWGVAMGVAAVWVIIGGLPGPSERGIPCSSLDIHKCTLVVRDVSGAGTANIFFSKK